MNFVQDATAIIEGLLEVNRDFLQETGCAKGTADAAAELLEVTYSDSQNAAENGLLRQGFGERDKELR